MKIETRKKAVDQLTHYGLNLLFTAVGAIVFLSYVPLTNDFTLGRGWRTFTQIFGGFGGVVVSFLVIMGVLAAVVCAVNAELPKTIHRWAMGSALLVIIILAALFGRSIVEMLFTGNTVFIIVFLGLVAVESAIEWWFARRRQRLSA